MKTFREHLKEEVKLDSLYTGGIDIERDVVRDEINGILSAVSNKPCVTPYNALNRIRKALAYFSIHLPKRTYMGGKHGVEAWEVHQFGDKIGMTDQGEFIKHVPAKYYLFMHYHLLGSMYYVEAKIVDNEELETKVSNAERMVAEEMDAAARQNIVKARAPKEDPHTALGDCDCSQGDSPSTKKAIKVSMKKIDEDKDPCWKGYEMIGMKKKGGRKVPNCVPVEEEEQIDEVSAGLAQRAAHRAFVKSDKMKADAKKEPDMHSYVQTFHKGEKKSKQGTKFAKYAAKKMEEEKGDRLIPQTMNNPTGRDKTGASERDRGITFVPKNTRGNDGDMPQNTLKPEGKYSNRVDPEGRRNEYAPGGTMYEKVAGVILKRIRAKHMKEDQGF